MGDTFSHIGANTVINNKSSVADSFNLATAGMSAENIRALKEISALVETSGSRGAASCLQQFTEQLSRPEKNKSVLHSLWKDLTILVPALVQLPAAAALIAELLRS